MREETYTFWKEQPADESSMLLLHGAKKLEEEERDEILSYLPPFAGREILDLGAGIGRFTTPFAQEAKRVIAVDFCDHFLIENSAKNRPFSNIEYLCSDARDLDLPAQSLDLIFFSWLFLYLEDEEVQKLIARCATWIKPGGSLFFRESCWIEKKVRNEKGYRAIYRTMAEYPTYFEGGGWHLAGEGNILAYEKYRSDPLKCYWLYVAL